MHLLNRVEIVSRLSCFAADSSGRGLRGRRGGTCPGGRVGFGRLVAGAGGCFTRAMVVYGIASSLSRDIDDFYASSEEADAVLAEILKDEPELEGTLWVERVEFELSAN